MPEFEHDDVQEPDDIADPTMMTSIPCLMSYARVHGGEWTGLPTVPMSNRFVDADVTPTFLRTTVPDREFWKEECVDQDKLQKVCLPNGCPMAGLKSSENAHEVGRT